jgi:cytochrome c553
MRTILSWGLKILAGLILLVCIAAAVIWFGAQHNLDQKFTPIERQFTAMASDIDIVEGERLANIIGCNGCHGDELEGKVMFEDPMFASIVAPNLTQITSTYSDQQLEVAIRQGIAPNGRGLIVMPSAYFSALRDQDLRNIIAYMRAVQKTEHDPGKTSVYFIGRALMLKGDLTTQPYIEQLLPRPDRAEGTIFYEGEYLTQIKCAECHGRDLQGAPFGLETTPSLVAVSGYTPDEFTVFMRTGVAKGGRNVGLMTEISATHFKFLRDEEISDLYEYIKSREWL